MRASVRASVLSTRLRHLATQPPKGPTTSNGNGAKASAPDNLESSTESVSKATGDVVTSLSLDFSPEEKDTERTGAKSSKDSLSSIERQRQFLGRSVLAILGVGVITGCVYLGREWDDEELKRKRMVRR